MPERIYTEAEIAALLGRAARLQLAGEPSAQEGLTLEEIKAAAAGAGINPRFVEMASSGSSDHESAYWSIPTGVGRLLVVHGSLTDDHWHQMVVVLSRELGGAGEIASRGRRRSWSRGPLSMTAEEVGDHIVLHAETGWSKDLELPIALTLVGAIAAATTGALALVSLEWTIGLIALLMTIIVAGAFSVYRSRMAARKEEYSRIFETVIDRCAAILHEGASADGATNQAMTDASERIALPDADPTANPSPHAAPRRRTNDPSGRAR